MSMGRIGLGRKNSESGSYLNSRRLTSLFKLYIVASRSYYVNSTFVDILFCTGCHERDVLCVHNASFTDIYLRKNHMCRARPEPPFISSRVRCVCLRSCLVRLSASHTFCLLFEYHHDVRHISPYLLPSRPTLPQYLLTRIAVVDIRVCGRTTGIISVQ